MLTDIELEDVRIIAELPYEWGKLTNKTLLISGATGFIGSFLCNVFAYRNAKYQQKIKVVSLSRGGGIDSETVIYKKVDISQPFSIDGKIDYVLHLASNTHPKQYSDDPIGTITTNIYGCDNLLKIARDNQARFLLASSVEIYGNGTEKLMEENYCGYIDCNQARAGYNESKRVSESLVQSYRKQYGIQGVIVRLARIFGADKKTDTKAMAQFISKAVAGKDIILHSKGNQRFSYCYIADAVSGILKVLLDGMDGEAYNITEEDEGLTIGEYAEYLASLSETKVIYQIENNSSASKSTYALLDNTKLKKLGWEPLFTVKEGLKRTIDIKRQLLV